MAQDLNTKPPTKLDGYIKQSTPEQFWMHLVQVQVSYSMAKFDRIGASKPRHFLKRTRN
jgi:hypothetical protein